MPACAAGIGHMQPNTLLRPPPRIKASSLCLRLPPVGTTMNIIESIDALLPQTQCGKCGHPGCKPYALGIAEGEAINKCPPGGDETIAGLAQLLKRPVLPLERERGEAPAQVAFIREAECIGCTKCIHACPVDAIVGAAKFMHTVIVDECTGCDLCVAPCPVDCIDMLQLPATVVPLVGGHASQAAELVARAHKRDHARRRFESRIARLHLAQQRRQAERLARQAGLSATRSTLSPSADAFLSDNEQALKKARITVTMSRAQLNKSLKAFGHPPIAEQAAQLVQLQQLYEAAEHELARLQLQPPASITTPNRAVNGSDLKRAKIRLALARAAVNKASAADAAPEHIARLNAELQDAQQSLDALQAPPRDAQAAPTLNTETPG
jgi:electron transport complex protein RnfB